ncbi:MAG: hypothetical protein SWQ30_22390 [Thermodesulfobacteriota bacterium]|nr:hypothetical protein [Thermodesulfobacteriota bacterium]
MMRIGFLVKLFFCLGVLMLCGCTAAIQNAVLDGQARMDTSLARIEAHGNDEARVVFYYAKLSLVDPMSGGVGSITLSVNGETGYIKGLSFMDGTGYIVDFPAGVHTFEQSKTCKICNNAVTFSLRFDPGETYYYRLQKGKPPELVSPEVAAAQLTKEGIRTEGEARNPNVYSGVIRTLVPFSESQLVLYSEGMTQKQLREKALEFNPAAGKARVYVIRNLFTMNGMTAGLDEKPMTVVSGDSFICYEVNPGIHILTTGIIKFNDIALAFKLNLVADHNYYFYHDKNTFISEQEAQKMLKKYDIVKNGFYKET